MVVNNYLLPDAGREKGGWGGRQEDDFTMELVDICADVWW